MEEAPEKIWWKKEFGTPTDYDFGLDETPYIRADLVEEQRDGKMTDEMRFWVCQVLSVLHFHFNDTAGFIVGCAWCALGLYYGFKSRLI